MAGNICVPLQSNMHVENIKPGCKHRCICVRLPNVRFHLKWGTHMQNYHMKRYENVVR